MGVEIDVFRFGAGIGIAVAPWDCCACASDAFGGPDDSATDGSAGVVVMSDGSCAGAGASDTGAVAVSVAAG